MLVARRPGAGGGIPDERTLEMGFLGRPALRPVALLLLLLSVLVAATAASVTAAIPTAGRRSGGGDLVRTASVRWNHGARVISFLLVNAKTGQTVRELREGATLDLTSPDGLAIVAVTSYDNWHKVVFTSPAKYAHQDSVAPYALAGVHDSAYVRVALPPGRHTVAAHVPDSVGCAKAVHFTVTEAVATVAVPAAAAAAAADGAKAAPPATCNVRTADCDDAAAALVNRYIYRDCLPPAAATAYVATAAALEAAFQVVRAAGCCALDTDRAALMKLSLLLISVDACVPAEAPVVDGAAAPAPPHTETKPCPVGQVVPPVEAALAEDDGGNATVTTTARLAAARHADYRRRRQRPPAAAAAAPVARATLELDAQQPEAHADSAADATAMTSATGPELERAPRRAAGDLPTPAARPTECCGRYESRPDGKGCCERVCRKLALIFTFYLYNDCCDSTWMPYAERCHA